MSNKYGPKIITDGLVLHLDAGDRKSYSGTGTTWYDRSKYKNHGTLTNGPTYNSGNGGSIVFDGADDYVTNDINILSSQYTILIFFKIKSFTSHDMRIIGAISGNTSQLAIGWNNTTFRLWLNSSWNDTSFISLTNINYHVAIVQNTNNEIYVNGKHNYSINNKSATFTNLGLGNRFLGSYGTHFDGNIYNFKVYNRALTADEVSKNFNAMKGRYNL